MSYNSFDSRSDRYEKRRKNTKFVNILIIVAVLLTAFLIGMIFFDSEDKDGQTQDETADENNIPNQYEESDTEEDTADENVENENDDGNEDSTNQSEENNEEQNEEEQSNNEQEDTESNDEEVKETISGDWNPYPTEQEEPHTIDFSEGSQDRQEMEFAISETINVSRDQLIYWWLESGGVPDRVTGYVEDRSRGEYYRVYLQWIENEGWEPQRAEVLYENIGKQKLESN